MACSRSGTTHDHAIVVMQGEGRGWEGLRNQRDERIQLTSSYPKFLWQCSMSAPKPISVAPVLPALPAPVHCLPCKISYSGPAPVESYFRPEPAAGPCEIISLGCVCLCVLSRDGTRCPCAPRRADGKLTATFRGRQLEGAPVTLPPHMQGRLLLPARVLACLLVVCAWLATVAFRRYMSVPWKAPVPTCSP